MRIVPVVLGAAALLVVLVRAPAGWLVPLLGLLLACALLAVGGTACALVCAAAWPGAVERSRIALRNQPLRCWLLGVLVALLEVWLLTVVPDGPPRTVAALIAILVDVPPVARGFPALAGTLGRRLGASDPARAVATGTVLVAACGTLPVLGWLLAGNLCLQALGAGAVSARR